MSDSDTQTHVVCRDCPFEVMDDDEAAQNMADRHQSGYPDHDVAALEVAVDVQ